MHVLGNQDLLFPLLQILEHLCELCVTVTHGKKKNNKHEQRLLRNMGAHTVVVELLQIPYEKVRQNFYKQKFYIPLLNQYTHPIHAWQSSHPTRKTENLAGQGWLCRT